MASTPYQAYTGDLSAPINAQQQTGISGINAGAGYASPFIQQASQQAGVATSPITGQTIQQYQNPYTQQVVDATTQQMSHDNASQMASLQGNQIAAGALGGNATGVAKGILAGQQGRTMASTVAGLYDQSYKQALGAAQQQQQTGLAGANAQANYGISGQNAALTGASAQVGAGSLQQTAEQAALDRQYQQYAQAQAFPYQQTQWLAGLGTGVGSNLGGTSQGSQTGPAPNQTAQWLGLGLSAAGMLSDRDAKEDIERIGRMNDGTPMYRFRYKGSPDWHVGPMAQEVEKRNPDAVSRGVDGYRYVDMHEATEDSVERASGGKVEAPWGDVGQGWIPSIGIAAGRGAPPAASPSGGGQQGGGFDPSKLASGLAGAAKGVGGLDWGGLMGGGGFSGEGWGGGGFFGGDAYGGSSGSPLAGLDASDYGAGFADGGAVMSDEDPVGVAGGQQYAQQAGSPWQMRPTGGGQVQVINIRTGQVVYTGSASGASNAQASMSSRPRAAGGGVAGYAGGGAPFDDRYDASFPARNPTSDVQDWLSPQGMFGEGEPQLPKGASFEDRAAPTTTAIAGGDFDPMGSNSTEFTGTPGMQASNRGVVPMPGARPEDAGPPVVAQDDEEGPSSGGVSGRSRGAPTAPVMAFGPEGGRDAYGNLPDAIRRPSDERGGFGLLPISKNASHGLLTAGLGMLASRSPFLGNAVGEGGLTGVAAYGQAEENDRKIAAEAQKLAQESRKDSMKFGLDVRRQDESERHNRASEKNAAADRTKAPMGMRFNATGALEDIPGWIPTLEKAAKARKGPEGEVMDDDTAQFMADRIIAGDTKVLTGLGRGAQGAANIMKVQQLVARRAASGEPVSEAAREILNNAAQFEGLKTAERTQAAIMSKLSVYGRTAFNATDIALDLSKEVPRTSFQPVNKIINAAKTKTGDPKIVALGQALMTLTNEYARAIGGGHGTVHDKEAAEKRLSEAQSHEQLEAVIKVMRREILAEERAMPAARQHIRDIYNPKPGGAVKSIAGEHGAEPPKGPVPGASGFSPPAGAIPRTYQGKTYYYDPATKQPYPGQ